MSSDSDEPLAAVREKRPRLAPAAPGAPDTASPPSRKRKNRKRKKFQKLSWLRRSGGGAHGGWGAGAGSAEQAARPSDVWLYLKDLTPTGPYSCLLCTEWFINRTKLVVHYVLNHKKDYCGICRYFVEDREAWVIHMAYHLPITCSQCPKQFQAENDQREHFRVAHGSVHCRFCGFMLPDKEYNEHLFQRHSITSVANRDLQLLWETEYEGSPKFICFLCTKSTQPATDFVRHFMFYHKFTIKCFTSFLSGFDVPFSVYGANISSTFMETALKLHPRMGYVERDKEQNNLLESTENIEGNVNLLNLIPVIKQEASSDTEERMELLLPATETNDDKSQDESENDENNACEKTSFNPNAGYKGVEDYDITLTEIVVMEPSYIKYLDEIFANIESNTVPIDSNLKYQVIKDEPEEIQLCALCPEQYPNFKDLTSHIVKMHCVKQVPKYFCRLCVATFDMESELKSHIKDELDDFDDLWICQFCDIEFDGRENARKHLNEHWSELKIDNCFSPHMGFKCRYCPTLFWNEMDREGHQNRVHFEKHKEDFYKCIECSMMFSDKIWFVHHYWHHHLSEESRQTVRYMVKCAVCCVVFATMDEIKQHFYKIHPEAKKIFCSLGSCRFRPFSQNKSFKMHLQTFHGPNPKQPLRDLVSCMVCGREFTNPRACSTHTALAHGPGRFKCKLCGENLQSSDERKLHFMISHPGRHQFECSDCGKSFQYKSSLYTHRSECHINGPRTYTCKYCSKQFGKKDSFKEHILIHEGPRHTCSYCPMRFVQRSNMLRHQRRHTGERPYSCVQCGRCFSDKGACNAHLKTHGPQERHHCPYCGRSFHQKSKLKYHLRKHTGQDLESCHVCSKLFTSPYNLREHMKTHEKLQDTECPICGRKYTSQRYFVRHMRTAHNTEAEVYNCPICEKALSSMVSLRQHVMTHSNIKNFQCRTCSKAYSCRKTMLHHLKKKHGVTGAADITSPYMSQVDPRQLDLGLDEEALTAIFGRMRKPNTDVIISDYVTFPKNLPIKDNDGSGNEEPADEGNAKEKEGSSDNEIEDFQEVPISVESVKSKKHKKKIITYEYQDVVQETKAKKKKKKHKKAKRKSKTESSDDAEGDCNMEPTDFVTVKIEPDN